MVKPLFDTNILIDYLNGIEAARRELSLYPEKAISIISWMEVMAGIPVEADEQVRRFLQRFEILAISQEVAESAVAVRKEARMKLPDAIIMATAKVHGLLLVSRNSKDFPDTLPGVRMPYTLS
jgi:predicted nucleic acid-binding protein